MRIFKLNIEKMERRQDINGLRKAIYNEDLQISQRAIEALGRISNIGFTRSIDALLELATATTTPENRIQYAVKELIPLLNSNKISTKDTLPIIKALGKLGEVEPLISKLNSSNRSDILKAIAPVLILLGETQAIEHKVEELKASWTSWGWDHKESLESLIGKEATQKFNNRKSDQELKLERKKEKEEEKRIRRAGFGGHFTKSKEAINFLFSIKMAKLPLLSEPQKDESYKKIIKTLGPQPVVNGTQEEINDILVKNVNGLAKRKVCGPFTIRPFNIQPFPDESNEKAAEIILYTRWGQLLQAYLWKTSTKLIAYGCPELLVTEETREYWEPYMVRVLLKNAYSYGESTSFQRTFAEYPQYNEIRYHGKNIYKRRGHQGMGQIDQSLRNSDPSDQALRMLGRFWDGVGQWRA